MADGKDQEVCRKFRNTGSCRYEDQCKFVHSEGEALPNPPPKPCFNFRDTGSCRFGRRCRFLHPSAEGDNQNNGDNQDNGNNQDNNGDDSEKKINKRRVRANKGGQKKPGMCFAFKEKKECQYGDNCRFRHGDNDDRDFGVILEAIKKSRGECYEFQKSGTCNFNQRCRFSHDIVAQNNEGVAQN